MKRSKLKTVVFGLLFGSAMLAPIDQAPEQIAAAPSPSREPVEQATDAARIDRLIRQLGNLDFAERDAASKALEAIGEAALPALRKAQDDTDLEIRRRVRDLIRIQKQRRSAMRAKAWDRFKELGHIDSDTGTPDGRIGVIHLDRGKIHDEDLAWLQWTDEIGGLVLTGPKIKDTALVYLKKLPRLEILDLESTNVTDAGLAQLKELDRLVCLGFCGTRVTGAGLVHLKGLKKLQQLVLSHTPITDGELDYVKEIKTLIYLNLAHTQVTDAGLAKLTGLELFSLDLSHTQVTDAGLDHLRKIRTLTMLRVGETKVTKQASAEWLEKEKKWLAELEKRSRAPQRHESR